MALQNEEQSLLNNSLELKTNYISYDGFGNILQAQKVNDFFHSYIWDYSSSYLVAEVNNATQSDVAYTSFESDGMGNWGYGSSMISDQSNTPTGKKVYDLDGAMWKNDLNSSVTYRLSFWSKGSKPGININFQGGTSSIIENSFTEKRSIGDWKYYEGVFTGAIAVGVWKYGNAPQTFIDEVRLCPVNAQMTTYTYNPLVGLTSQTDPNGKTIYYLYDAFNRLQFVKDQEGKILKKICYNYAGQQTDCSVNVSPAWTATGNLQCETDGNSNYTGYQLREEKDTNPNSPTYNQAQWVSNGYNTSACPLPNNCNYSNCESTGPEYRCVNGSCEQGYRINTDSYYDYYSGMYICTYHYEWSDGMWSQDYYEYNGYYCPL